LLGDHADAAAANFEAFDQLFDPPGNLLLQ
jgi:hypothetical protein